MQGEGPHWKEEEISDHINAHTVSLPVTKFGMAIYLQ